MTGSAADTLGEGDVLLADRAYDADARRIEMAAPGASYEHPDFGKMIVQHLQGEKALQNSLPSFRHGQRARPIYGWDRAFLVSLFQL